MRELLRLRGEVALLRHDRAELAKLMKENARLRGSLPAATESGAKTEHLSQEEEAAKQVGIAKLNFLALGSMRSKNTPRKIRDRCPQLLIRRGVSCRRISTAQWTRTSLRSFTAVPCNKSRVQKPTNRLFWPRCGSPTLVFLHPQADSVPLAVRFISASLRCLETVPSLPRGGCKI